MKVNKFISHSKTALQLAVKQGWFPGARYTNLRDIREFEGDKLFIDIDWKNYDLQKHLDAVAEKVPFLTIARDIERISELDSILKEAEMLRKYSDYVAVVPKDLGLTDNIDKYIPKHFVLAYSVPTKYGGTNIPLKSFSRPVHLLGGRPDEQRKLAQKMNVFSFDCNRFTYDARFGDYFDGETFRPHPKGGYENCLLDSILQINSLWDGYRFDCSYLINNCGGYNVRTN